MENKYSNKTFIILQGGQGSGKSTLSKHFTDIFGEDALVCPDNIREMCGAINYDEDGNAIEISQELNKIVFEIFYKIVASRIARGRPVIVDATHPTYKSMSRYKEMLENSGYKVEVHKCDCSLDTLLQRNKMRGYKNVPEEVVMNTYERLKSFKPDNWYTYIVHNTEE